MRALIALTIVITIISGCRSTQKSEISDAVAPQNVLPYITNMRQLSFEGRRAGEGYFSRDGKKLIFQSERDSANPFYQIYLMNLETGETKRVSPGRGKTTCAWIHPEGKKVLFSSTHADPDLDKKVAAEREERKNPKSKYNWSFDEAYDIYEASADGKNLKNLTKTKGYDAEASYSPDGKWIAFASNRAAYQKPMDAETAKIFARDASYMMDLYIMKADGSAMKQLTTHKGYDGGPFFSPDGKRLTFRRFSADGHSAEIFTINVDGTDEKQLTQLKSMSWAPFYHPSGDYLIFATNKEGYANFELYIVDVNGTQNPVRVSNLPNFDGLPVFSPDGRSLIWTHSNENNEAQLYRADWNDALARQALKLAPPSPSLTSMRAEIDANDAKLWVEYLASEKFEGRPTGGKFESEYVSHLAKAFAQMGLKPGVGNQFEQTYEFVSGIELQPKNALTLTIGSTTENPAISNAWIPLSYSKTGEFPSAPVVFAGYGMVAAEGNGQPAYNSYEGLDVKGKWVLAFAGLPEEVTNERRFHLHLYSRLQHKAMMARQNGAIGLIVIEDAKTPSPDLQLSFEGRSEDAGLPVLRLSPALADRIFKSANSSRAEWTTKLQKGEVGHLVFPAVSLKATVDLRFKKSTAKNVIAKLDAPGSHSSLIVGAHLDHLGRGEGGGSLSKVKNSIHYGADDNASGVAGVMEIAHWLANEVNSGKIKLKHNVYFALWTGEEIGVLGSSHFVKSKAMLKLTAALNLDMIGRMQDHLIVQGVGSAKEWRSVIERVNFGKPLTLRLQEDPYLPTDAMSFYLQGIPSISFFTGSHPQYHTGEDKPELINYTGLTKIADWVGRMTVTLGTSSTPMVHYQKVEASKNRDSSRGFRLFLGTIPDYSQEGQKGVLISGTSKGSPAEKAGLQAGDVIIELGGMKVQNLNDYVYCLQALKANEQTKMRILRAGAEKELQITPQLKRQTQ